jgi:chorismate-pyruvate lyase
MEIIESLTWVTLGFLPMLGSMELAWRLHKKLAKPKLKAIRESRFVKVNRQLAELLPSSNGDRVWIREV